MVSETEQTIANKYPEEPPRPRFMAWFRTFHFIGRHSKSYIKIKWKVDAEIYFEYYFFRLILFLLQGRNGSMWEINREHSMSKDVEERLAILERECGLPAMRKVSKVASEAIFVGRLEF